MVYEYWYNNKIVSTNNFGKGLGNKKFIVEGIYSKYSKVSENDTLYLVLSDKGKLTLEKVGRARAALIMFSKDMPKHFMKVVKRVLKDITDEKGFSEVMFFEDRKQLKELIRLKDKLKEDENYDYFEDDEMELFENHRQYLVADFE